MKTVKEKMVNFLTDVKKRGTKIDPEKYMFGSIIVELEYETPEDCSEFSLWGHGDSLFIRDDGSAEWWHNVNGLREAYMEGYTNLSSTETIELIQSFIEK